MCRAIGRGLKCPRVRLDELNIYSRHAHVVLHYIRAREIHDDVRSRI